MDPIELQKKKGFICDMDGVIYHGSHVLPGVPEFIQWLNEEKKSYLFLTNNSGSTPKELQQKLARMGLDVDETHFYTSALATAYFLDSQAPGCSAYVVGEHGITNALYDKGITYNDVNPDYVVVGESSAYNLEQITKAIRLVNEGKIQLKPLQTAHFAFEDYQAAYQFIDDNREKTMKVIIDVDPDTGVDG